ncbi:MAG: hypothetical protein EPN93_18155 [Spirochaetes bacterium]|nr:MAG: hypothetical protein EPN93_18155 [Spirochaetota bacterium]
MEPINPTKTLHAASTEEWRRWLSDNGQIEKSVWLIIYHKNSTTLSVRWHDAIENALCFGWVDSKAIKRDKESCFLKFTPRNPKSRWGKRNRERALKMIESGLMTRFGQALIDSAKGTGKWDSE